jgi:hypothetical protein
MARINVEVGTLVSDPTVLGLILPTEQKKAALRRVEMELDEADEMVRSVCISIPFPVPSLPPGLANGD